MTDARCEPPEGTETLTHHWLKSPWRKLTICRWNGSGWEQFARQGYVTPERAGSTYVAPVPSPEAVARLVEAAKDFSVAQATGRCRLSHATALRKALEPFGGAI